MLEYYDNLRTLLEIDTGNSALNRGTSFHGEEICKVFISVVRSWNMASPDSSRFLARDRTPCGYVVHKSITLYVFSASSHSVLPPLRLTIFIHGCDAIVLQRSTLKLCIVVTRGSC